MIRWILSMIVASVSFAGDIKICVALTVENDETVIMSCLNSIQPLCDCILVYDMGSTDRTIDIVQQFLAKTKIPGVIQNHQNNFDQSAFECAKQVIRYAHLSPEDTYILSLEPHMLLQIGPTFCKNNLVEEAYLVLEKTPSFSSYRPHLVRSQCFPERTKSAMIKSLTIDKQEDLARKIDEYSVVLQKEPDNGHAFFLMAQSKQALNQYKEAIQYYQQAIIKKIDPEEVWFSRVMIGECYENLDCWDDALYWYLEAFQANPNRSEPLKKISSHYRLSGQNDLSYIFAKFGSRLPLPDDQIYFDAQPLQDYQFDEDLSIVSYYTQFREDGYTAASDLVLKRNVPEITRQQTYRNLLFYLEPLKNALFLPIEFERPFLTDETRWFPMNPSICKTENGFDVICRTVSYVQKEAREFHTYDKNGFYRSRNFLLQYDWDFHLLSQHEIVENQFRIKIGTPLVQGFEDCRIFKWQQGTWFSCTTTDTNPTGQYQISLCKLEDEPSTDDVAVDFFRPLNGPNPDRCEKNWLPFVLDNNLYFIYSFNPLVIYEPDLSSGDCKEVWHLQPECDFSSFRCSAGPISFNDGYLVVVHEIAFLPESRRSYMHRFLFLDKNFKITRVTKPFIFKNNGIEFCCGMCWDPTQKKVILTVGIEDREAYLCIVDADTIDHLLRPLPEINR